MGLYNWPTGTERYRKVARFVRAFFDRLHDLQSPPYHPKWREINVAVPVPGWTRFAAAQEWIRKAGLDTNGATRNARVNDSDAKRGMAALGPHQQRPSPACRIGQASSILQVGPDLVQGVGFEEACLTVEHPRGLADFPAAEPAAAAAGHRLQLPSDL